MSASLVRHPLRFTEAAADRLLRAPRPSVGPLGALVAAIVFGLFYGLVMGTYSGLWGGRSLQLLYSAVKVPMLLMITFGLALPSFFVLNTLAGMREDFGEVLRALLAVQAGLTLVLASLAPLTLFWYAGVPNYQAAILFNAGCFGLASLAGQLLLVRFYRPLEARNPTHRLLRRTWLGLYAFVGVQMGWVLRPFIGQPGSPEQFFREGAWGNAYVELFQIARNAVGL